MTTQPQPGNRARALTLLEAAEFMRDAHFRDGLTVQEITTALAHTVDRADAMVGSLSRDGFGAEEIAEMLSAEPAAVSAAVAPPTQAAPSLRAGLRDEIVKALGRITTVPPVAHRREQADHVLAVLYREWPWLRAEAEDAEPTDRAAAEAALAAVETALGDTLVPDAREEALAGITAVLPEAADKAAVLHEEADRIDATRADFPIAVQNGITWATAEMRRHAAELRRMADETATETPHTCDNCEGVDPDTCFNNPSRPPEQCPAAEFEDYGQQCQKPAGHNLHSFEEQPAAGARQDGTQP